MTLRVGHISSLPSSPCITLLPPTLPMTPHKLSAMAVHKHHHFLVVTLEAQGHINPARRLARNLVLSGRACVTLALPTAAYRSMFPSATGEAPEDADGLISYIHYPDPFGAKELVLSEVNPNINHSLSSIAGDLAARGRPLTCIIYSLLLSPAADVARNLGIPSVLFWIQPATVFAIYSAYFHGYLETRSHQKDPSFSVDLPGLPPLQIRDLPSCLTSPNPDANPVHSFLLIFLKDMFEALDREAETGMPSKPRILVNTFEELESDVLSKIPGLQMIAVGPLVATETRSNDSVESVIVNNDLYKEDKRGYIEWLDNQAEDSVVYVSFGSMYSMSIRQVEELAKGLAESGRPYLWVVRKNNREGDVGKMLEGEDQRGMIVEWCLQERVLSHPAIGCFVTHCGWNSMLESMVCGVPMVMAPQWSDQTTNARLAEGEWGTGVTALVDGERVLQGTELRRCLDIIMGEEGAEIRFRTRMWREKAVEAVGDGGSSKKYLMAFMEGLDKDTIETTDFSKVHS